MISYQPCKDLLLSAGMTIDNMRTYYEHHSVDWDRATIVEQITSLDNWDILFDGEVVGAFRLEYDSEGCYLRDLQVSHQHQNKGIGAKALVECMRQAKVAGVNKIRLRVFKISPAHHLYTRSGFDVYREDDKFYYMSCVID